MNFGSCLRLPVLGLALAGLCTAGGSAWAGIKIVDLDTTWSPDGIAVFCERHQGILWGIEDYDSFGRYGCLTDEYAVECDTDGNCTKIFDEEAEEARARMSTRPTTVT